MAEISEKTIMNALKSVEVPGTNSNVVSLGLLSGVVGKNGAIHISIEAKETLMHVMDKISADCEIVVRQLPGVSTVHVILTAERAQVQNTDQQQSEPKIGAAGVKWIVAVASGKGGVGKSTTAVNLTVALSRLGQRVGILDADIYGPSVPRMMGVDGHPKSLSNNQLQPLESYGIKCMSMGFLVQEEEPTIWRGPMVMSALEQMLNDVMWSPLDILIVDLPPGTGDVQLTLSQRTKLAGAIIISTPQDIALMDVIRSINMFRRVHVPIIGVVENMSYFICPGCGKQSHIFSSGGVEKAAKDMSIPFLGRIPLDMSIRETSDGGQPIVISKASGQHAKDYMEIAGKVLDKLEDAENHAKTPTIRVD